MTLNLIPDPKHSSSNAFSIWNCNLNSTSNHKYAKVFLLKAYIAIQKFGIICISETYLDSSTPSDENNLEISWCNLIWPDHSLNN